MRLIDADVFKENLDKEFETATDAHDAVDFALEDTPTIEAEPVKHGKWVVTDCDSGEPNGYSAFIEFHCPFCNEPYTLESGEYNWYYPDEIPLNYCHNCGAKMDLEG